MSTVYLGLDWYNLNDGQLETQAATLNLANAYMELDFGAGGVMVDTVAMDFATGPADADYTRINGVTLSVMDDQRTVILQYTITDFTMTSSVRRTWPVASA